MTNVLYLVNIVSPRFWTTTRYQDYLASLFSDGLPLKPGGILKPSVGPKSAIRRGAVVPSKKTFKKKKRPTKGKPADSKPKSAAPPPPGTASRGGGGLKRPWALANRPEKGAGKGDWRQYYQEWRARPTVAEDEGELRVATPAAPVIASAPGTAEDAHGTTPSATKREGSMRSSKKTRTK